MASDFTGITSGFVDLRQTQIVGNYIYGSSVNGNNTATIYKYDITTPSVNPVSVGTVPSNGAIAIDTYGNIYTACFAGPQTDGKIYITDINNISSVYYNPSYPGYNIVGLIWDTVNSQLIGIASTYNTYYIINNSGYTPINYIGTSNSQSGITCDSTFMYILTLDRKVTQIYLSTGNIATIIDLTSIISSGTPQGITVSGNYLLVGCNNTNNTIYVIDITTPAIPALITSYNTENINITSIVSANDFVYFNNNNNNLYISNTSFCFNEGTKILCMNHNLQDEYIRIELLKVGDFVKTYKHGYRKVSKVITGKLRNNPKKWNMCMYKMIKTPTNGLMEDLIVTGGHSLLVDSISDAEQAKYDEMGLTEFSKLTIDNKRLLLSSVSDQFIPMQDREIYTYYHLLLENNDDDEERFGIYANGVLTETPNVKTVK